MKKKKKTSVVVAGKKEMGVRTDAPPKVEKVHVLPHLPVVVRNALSSSSSAPSFAAAAATTSAAATAARSRASTTARGGHRTDAPPRMDKVTVLPHLPARADGGWIAPSSSSTSTSSSTTTKTVGAVGAAGGEGASAAAAFEQKQHQNVNAEGLDFSSGHPQDQSPPVTKRPFECCFSLCLSRACLGKSIVFTHKNGAKKVFSAPRNLSLAA